jgi:stage II sporulation protein GA (sporulation sigma-E factor processing peptidase)
MKTIYIDVLIVLNIYVNYFLLRATAKFTHTLLKTWRCILAAVFGSLFSLLILAPDINFFLNLLIKLAAAALVVFAAFGFKDIAVYVKLLLYFYGVNFIFAGVMLTFYLLLKPSFMQYNNSFVYIDFSLAALVVFTVLAYGIICLVRLLLDKKTDDVKYTVTIKHGRKLVCMDGFADTGNVLLDSFTGKHVIICPNDGTADLFNGITVLSDDLSAIPKGFRLLPFSTASGSGLLPIFKPDEVIIMNELTHVHKRVDALIGVNKENTAAIFNPKLLL